MPKNLPGLRLVRHVGAGIRQPQDPTYPFMLTINRSPPEFMDLAFIMLNGGSEIIEVQGMTEEALQEFITVNNFRTHPRLRHITLVGPGGEIEKFRRGDPIKPVSATQP